MPRKRKQLKSKKTVVDEPLVVRSEPLTGVSPDPTLDEETPTNMEINDLVIPAQTKAPIEIPMQVTNEVQQAHYKKSLIFWQTVLAV